MNKRERLERTVAGEAADRPPVVVWRRFPGDDQRAADLARSVVEFQQYYDWDFVKVTPSDSYSVIDYGLQDEWRGSLDGTRITTRCVIQRSLDWTTLRPLDPLRASLGRLHECLEMVCGTLGEAIPVTLTLFNPLAQAAQLAG